MSTSHLTARVTKLNKHKITRKIFRCFCERVHFYATNLSLRGWELEVVIGEESTENRATCMTSLDDKYCKITVDPVWDCEPIDDIINKAAFHEVLELLLAPIVALGKERFVTERQFSEAGHAVIMRLQNMLLD